MGSRSILPQYYYVRTYEKLVRVKYINRAKKKKKFEELIIILSQQLKLQVSILIQIICIQLYVFKYSCLIRGNPLDVVANMLDCNILVSEFELLSRYYDYFRTDTLEKGMNPFIPPAMG